MFGISALFAALARLTTAINTSAGLFESANAHLTRQLGIDGPADAPLPLENHADDAPARNGRKAKASAS